MLIRAWSRATAILFRRSPALILSNLQASLFLGLWALGFAAAWALQPAPWGLLALNLGSAFAAWMALSWVFHASRAAMEDPHFRPGFRELRRWFATRAAERALSFCAVLALGAWISISLSFYRAAASGFWAATAALAFIGAAAFVLASALAMNFPLAARPAPAGLAEWKASLYMALAFAPQCLLALSGMALFSGAAGIALGSGGFWGRLASLPALAMPLFGAAYAALFLCSLSDEFLARSHGKAPPAYEPFSLKELMQPWR